MCPLNAKLFEIKIQVQKMKSFNKERETFT